MNEPEETEEVTQEVTEEKSPETPPESGVFDEEPKEAKPERPAGYDPVDLENATPEQVQERIDYLYRQVKFSERDKEELRKHNEALAAAVDKLNGRMGDIEQGKKVDEISTIKRQIAEAYEEGEYERAVELTDALTDLKAAAKSEPEKKEEKPKEALPAEQEAILTEWLSETGDDGEPLHAYADPNHEDHALATGLAMKLAKDPIAMSQAKSMGDFLDLLDDQMKKHKSRRAPVSSSRQDIRPSEGKKVELSEEEKQVARRMGLSPDDYAKQKAVIEGINA